MKNLKSTSGLTNSITLDHKTADDGQGIVNLFSRYFTISVYKKKTSIPNYNNLSPVFNFFIL